MQYHCTSRNHKEVQLIRMLTRVSRISPTGARTNKHADTCFRMPYRDKHASTLALRTKRRLILTVICTYHSDWWVKRMWGEGLHCSPGSTGDENGGTAPVTTRDWSEAMRMGVENRTFFFFSVSILISVCWGGASKYLKKPVKLIRRRKKRQRTPFIFAKSTKSVLH